MINLDSIVYKLPIDVDVDKLNDEALKIINCCKKARTINKRASAVNIAVTGNKNTPLYNWYDHNIGDMNSIKDAITGEELTKDFENYTIGFPGPFREVHSYYANGNNDRELTHWHPDMVNSEMFRLKDQIASYFNISNTLRCRLSLLYGHYWIGKHADPHTPWRVHINLKAGLGCRWKFHDIENNESIEWYQPTGSVWLVRTGNIQHEVTVPVGSNRLQLFYHIWERDLGPNYHQIA